MSGINSITYLGAALIDRFPHGNATYVSIILILFSSMLILAAVDANLRNPWDEGSLGSPNGQPNPFNYALVCMDEYCDITPEIYGGGTSSPAAVKEVDTPPKLVWMKFPDYPKRAGDMAMEGKVLLRVLVDKRGKAKEVEIIKEIPANAGFGQPCIEQAQKAIFTPAFKDNKPVQSWVTIPIEFSPECNN